MAKKKEINKEETEEPKIEKQIEEKYPLIELVLACSTDDIWIIYNLSRTGLLEQYEQEMKDYGIKDIEPSLTVEEFNKIINGA